MRSPEQSEEKVDPVAVSVKTRLWRKLLRYLQENSNSALANRIQAAASSIYRATHNPNYHITTNGELRAIKIISGFFEKKVFVDVGANVGQWSLMAANALNGNGIIYSFEPSRWTHEVLVRNTNNIASIRCFNIGLSNVSQSMNILFSGTNPEKSSVESLAVQSLNRKIVDYETETQSFLCGDEFCERNSIQEISFLKIDTEGHDYKVLEGFSKMLKGGRVHAIQFEYNRLNIYAKTLLYDFYELLNPPASRDAFRIGRVFPHSVRFKNYDPLDENFIDGNFIAVRRSHVELIDRLQN
jgi:FkbM family methyltransferase